MELDAARARRRHSESRRQVTGFVIFTLFVLALLVLVAVLLRRSRRDAEQRALHRSMARARGGDVR